MPYTVRTVGTAAAETVPRQAEARGDCRGDPKNCDAMPYTVRTVGTRPRWTPPPGQGEARGGCRGNPKNRNAMPYNVRTVGTAAANTGPRQAEARGDCRGDPKNCDAMPYNVRTVGTAAADAAPLGLVAGRDPGFGATLAARPHPRRRAPRIKRRGACPGPLVAVQAREDAGELGGVAAQTRHRAAAKVTARRSPIPRSGGGTRWRSRRARSRRARTAGSAAAIT
jgi:hypothetical protein